MDILILVETLVVVCLLIYLVETLVDDLKITRLIKLLILVGALCYLARHFGMFK